MLILLQLLIIFRLDLLKEKESQQNKLFIFLKYCLAQNPITNIAYQIRKLAIPLLVQLNLIQEPTLISILRPLRSDQDPRIRLTFVQTIRQSSVQSDIILDEVCKSVFKEENLEVRKEIFRLIVDKANREPANINDAVKQLCIQIRAMVKEMRIFSAGLLQELNSISEATVIQMIQKESFFQQKFVQIGQQQKGQQSQQMIKSKAKKGMAVQEMQKDPQSPAQVTGILLLMLEDDSMDVRIAGIKAISHFAKQVKEIRKQCLNFLIDMLNDEIDEVRIGALHGISGFNEILALNDEEVDSVLFNLNEDNQRLREEIYKFFGRTIINQTQLFQKLLKKLYENLRHFSQKDQHFIFELLRQLGQSHSGLVSSLFYKILGIDKRFQAIDPSWSDIVHVGKMILIYAAANERPEILKEAPNFVYKSLDYLKDEYSQYFIGAFQKLEMQYNPFDIQTSEEDNGLKNQINLFYQQGLLQQILKLTKNSMLQVGKSVSNLKELGNNFTDIKLSLVYLISKFLNSVFIQYDELKALEIKLQILTHYPNLSKSNLQIINYVSSCLYIRLLLGELETTTGSAIFYHQRFLEISETLYELMNNFSIIHNVFKEVRQILLSSILQDKSKCTSQVGRNAIKQRLTEAFNLFGLQEIQKKWPQIIENQTQFGYSAAFITHPKDNQTESFKFSSLHSEFIDLRGDLLQVCSMTQPTVVLHYPDDTYHSLSLQDPKSVQINQKIELTSENAWSRESNVEIFLTSTPEAEQFSEKEAEVFMKLIGNAKRAELDRNIVRFDDQNNKMLLIMSNIKKFLVLPK